MHRRLAPWSRISLALILAIASLSAFANVVGSDAQNFNPSTSGLDFVTVQSPQTLEPGIYNFGFFLNYARNPLPVYDPTAAKDKKITSLLVGSDLNFGLGIARNWDAGLSAPANVYQQVDLSTTTVKPSTGLTELRLNSKYRLIDGEKFALAFVGTVNFNMMAKNPYLGEGGGPVYSAEIAGASTIGRVIYGLNVGYRWRNPGKSMAATTGIEPLVDQWLASGAISYRIDRIDSKLVVEILASEPIEKKAKTTNQENSVLEGLIGLKYDRSDNLSFHGGVGGGLISGISSPELRVYAGLNFSFGSIKEKRSSRKDPYRGAALRRVVRERPPRPKETAAKKRKREALEEKESQSVATTTPATQQTPEPTEVAEAETPAQPVKDPETINDVNVFDRGTFNHIVLHNIEFASGTMHLTVESDRYVKNELITAIRQLNSRRAIEAIVVEGHSDSLGERISNLRLSKARADVVGALLRQNLGINLSIRTIGVGSSQPIADNGNFQGRALNRRVELKLLYRTSSSTP